MHTIICTENVVHANKFFVQFCDTWQVGLRDLDSQDLKFCKSLYKVNNHNSSTEKDAFEIKVYRTSLDSKKDDKVSTVCICK